MPEAPALYADADGLVISASEKRRGGEVAKLLAKYADVPLDLADACLVDLATQTRTSQILTLDSDFKIYRWGRNRVFDILLDTV